MVGPGPGFVSVLLGQVPRRVVALLLGVALRAGRVVVPSIGVVVTFVCLRALVSFVAIARALLRVGALVVPSVCICTVFVTFVGAILRRVVVALCIGRADLRPDLAWPRVNAPERRDVGVTPGSTRTGITGRRPGSWPRVRLAEQRPAGARVPQAQVAIGPIGVPRSTLS